MATQTQADNAKYGFERHYTDGTKTTFSHNFVRCFDKNENYSEWVDSVSADDDDDATILANAITYFKDNCTELPAETKSMDEEKSLN